MAVWRTALAVFAGAWAFAPAAEAQELDRRLNECMVWANIFFQGNPANVNLAICCAKLRTQFNEDPRQCHRMQDNVDMPGSNIFPEGRHASTATDCQVQCEQHQQCRSFTYVRRTQRCFIKHATPASVPNQCCISAVVRPEFKGRGRGTRFRTVPNAGIPGHNKEVLGGISLAACQNACLDRQWCKSVDYERNPKVQRCYLQPVNMQEVPLKTDYPGNPYDHYSLVD